MSIEIKVPTLPESVVDATVAKWYKKTGDAVNQDENLLDLETDKVMLEVPAIEDGVLEKILVNEGDVVKADQVLAIIKPGAVQTTPASDTTINESNNGAASSTSVKQPPIGPSARRLLEASGIDVTTIEGSGKGGRITKEDITQQQNKVTITPSSEIGTMVGERSEKRVPMSRLRAKVAERLVQVQQEAAILTTFNEINMQPVMDLRKRYKEKFQETHGTRLGFMSFFTKACIEALKRFPAVNASIDGNDVIYHNYYDIGIAIGSPRGLVVPILRNAENMGMADIEKNIRGYSQKATDGKLTMEELTGGTFTITNGGTYGSLLSTPIINPPQTAILGMHKIEERAVVEAGQVVARPVMFVALSYDHRLIDGREAVLFLVTIKELLEDPARMMLAV